MKSFLIKVNLKNILYKSFKKIYEIISFFNKENI